MNIDDANDTATIRVSSSGAEQPPAATPVHVLGQIAADGGGGIIVNGRFVPIPPWNPMAAVLQMIADIPTGEDANQTHFRNALTRQVLTGISAQVQAMIDEIDSFGGPDRRSRPFESPITIEDKSSRSRSKSTPKKR